MGGPSFVHAFRHSAHSGTDFFRPAARPCLYGSCLYSVRQSVCLCLRVSLLVCLCVCLQRRQAFRRPVIGSLVVIHSFNQPTRESPSMALLPCAFCFSLLSHPRDRMLSPMQNCCCRSTSPPGCATALFTNNCTFYSHVSRFDPKIRHSEIQEYIKYLNTTSAHCLW